MNCLPEKLSGEIIHKAKTLGTSLLTDAMNCTGGMDYLIKPCTAATEMAGTAMTVTLRPGDNLFLHQAIYDASPGYLIVADGKSHVEHAYLGELMTSSAEAIGLSGIVIDGLVRDKEILQAMDFPVFAKGYIPNGPSKEGLGDINIPITCGGVIVQPGDLVVGDQDGVAVVKRESITDVFERAEKKLMYESRRKEKINKYVVSSEKGELTESLEPSWLEEKIKNSKK